MDSSDRDPQGRFTASNQCGASTRFPIGRSGNPRGRPRSVEFWQEHMNHCSPDYLKAVVANPKAQKSQRNAARRILAEALVYRPLVPSLATRFDSLAKTTTEGLEAILLDDDAEPEQREAARQHLLQRRTVDG